MQSIHFSLQVILALCVSLILPSCINYEGGKFQENIPQKYIITQVKNGFELYFDPRAQKSVKEYYASGETIINGSYFGQNPSGLYFSAGLWKNFGYLCCTRYGSGVIDFSQAINYDDPNLSYIVGILPNYAIHIFPRHELSKNFLDYIYSFQAGPLVLSGNVLQDFTQSWHANELHERTLIGITHSNKIFFFTFIKPVSLSEVSQIIYDQFCDDPITLLNLDGGPSTAYYNGVYSFNENAKLPIIIRINK